MFQTNHLFKLLLALVSVFVLGAGSLAAEYYMRPSTNLKPAFPTAQDLTIDISWKRLMAVGLVTIMGIVFGYLFTRFSELHAKQIEEVDVRTELKRMLSSTSFYLGLLVSPIVFAVIIAASKGAPMLAALLLAFQNGFFWQGIMPKAKP